MTILFSHRNAIHPNAGGISKITSNLCELFRSHSITVKMLSLQPISEKNYKVDIEQYYLPDEHLFSASNREYAVKFIVDNNIDIIINQSALDSSTVDFWRTIHDRIEISIISCIHNSLLTPIYNFPYQFEWQWAHSGKHWLFRISKIQCVRKIVVGLYILLYRKKYRKLENYSDKIVFLCDGLANEFFKIIGRESEKVAVITNFSDNKEIQNAQSQKKNLILWAGTIDFRVKRIDFMLEAWNRVHKRIPTWHLAILGDGNGMESAIEYAKTLKLENYSFEGRVVPDSFYQQAKIICVTSSHESFSLVTLEAMGYGVVPVVNNSFPAASLLIKDKVNGILVKPFCREEFAKAIIELAETPQKIETMSIRALSESQNYRGEPIYDLWKSLFMNIK